jgi:hypothetical protein
VVAGYSGSACDVFEPLNLALRPTSVREDAPHLFVAARGNALLLLFLRPNDARRPEPLDGVPATIGFSY